jgi:hypothetical protein
MRRILKAVTDWLGYWQTWAAIVSGAGTMWGGFAAYLAGLPQHEIAMYTGITFATFTGGALLVVHLWEWLNAFVGLRARVPETVQSLRDLKTRGSGDVVLAVVVGLWTGHTGIYGTGSTEQWVRWTLRLRDLKQAAEDGVLITVPPGSHPNKTTKVTIDSALDFFESGKWKAYASR